MTVVNSKQQTCTSLQVRELSYKSNYSIEVGVSFANGGEGCHIAVLDERRMGVVFLACKLKLFIRGLEFTVDLEIKNREGILRVHDK